MVCHVNDQPEILQDMSPRQRLNPFWSNYDRSIHDLALTLIFKFAETVWKAMNFSIG